MPKSKYTEDFVQELVLEHIQGAELIHISRVYGVPYTTLCHFFSERGIKTNKYCMSAGDGYKYCWSCSRFEKVVNFNKDQSSCRVSQRVSRLAYNASPIGKFKSYLRSIKRRYDVDERDLQSMMNNQRGCCQICKRSLDHCEDIFHIDHCHQTGHVRGLLCSTCNHGLGMFEDDTTYLKEAIRYLIREEL